MSNAFLNISDVEYEVDELLSINKLKPTSNLSPCSEATIRRCQVQNFLTDLIRSNYDFNEVKVVGCGSTVLRTYLPESDLDMVVFPPSEISAVDCLRKIFNKFCDEIARKDQKNAVTNSVPVSSSDNDFVIRNMELVNARTKVLHCMVNNIGVDITVRQLGSVTALAFLEEADKILGNGHIFKRSLILIKSWCLHESRSYCGSSILSSKNGMFSSYALSVLVLHLFNRFGDYLVHPLAVLRCFLATYRYFPWDSYVVTIDDAVPIAVSYQKNEHYDSGKVDSFEDESGGFSSKPAATSRFTSILSKFEGIQLKSTVANANGSNSAPTRFIYRPCNIRDPLDHMNNLGVAVTRQTLDLIIRALNSASDHVEYILAPLPSALSIQQNQSFVAIDTSSICKEEKDAKDRKDRKMITTAGVDQDVTGGAFLESSRKRSASIHSKESVDGQYEPSRCSTVSPLLAVVQPSIPPFLDSVGADNHAEQKSTDDISNQNTQPLSITELPFISPSIQAISEKGADFERYTMKLPVSGIDKHIPEPAEEITTSVETGRSRAPLGTPLRAHSSPILPTNQYGDEYALTGAQNPRDEDPYSKRNQTFIHPQMSYSPHYHYALHDVSVAPSQSSMQYVIHSGQLAPQQQLLQHQTIHFPPPHPSSKNNLQYKQSLNAQQSFINPMHNGRVSSHHGKYVQPMQGQRPNLPQQQYYPSQPSPLAHQFNSAQKSSGYRKVPLRFPAVGSEGVSKKKDTSNFGIQPAFQSHQNFQAPKNSDSNYNKNSVGSNTNMKSERNRRYQQNAGSEDRSSFNSQSQTPPPSTFLLKKPLDNQPSFSSKEAPRISILDYVLPNTLRAYNLSHLPSYNKRCDLLDHPLQLQLQQQTIIFPNSSLSTARKYSFGGVGNESDSYNKDEQNKQRRRDNSLDTLSSLEAQDDLQSSNYTASGPDDSVPQDLLEGDLEDIWKIIRFLTIEDASANDNDAITISENESAMESNATAVSCSVAASETALDPCSPRNESEGVLQLKELLLSPERNSELSKSGLMQLSLHSGGGTNDTRKGPKKATGTADLLDLSNTKDHVPAVDLAASAQNCSILLEQPNSNNSDVPVVLRQKGKQAKRPRANDTHISKAASKESTSYAPLPVNPSTYTELSPQEIINVDAVCSEQTLWPTITAYSRPLLFFIVTVISACSIQRYWSSFLESYSSRMPSSNNQSSTWLQKREGALFVLNLTLPSHAASKTVEKSILSQGNSVTTRKLFVNKISDHIESDTSNSIEDGQSLLSSNRQYELVQWVVAGDSLTFGTDTPRQGLSERLPFVNENSYFLWTKDAKNVSQSLHDPAFPHLTLRRVGSQDAGRYRLFICSGSQSFLLTETLLKISSKLFSKSHLIT